MKILLILQSLVSMAYFYQPPILHQVEAE